MTKKIKYIIKNSFIFFIFLIIFFVAEYKLIVEMEEIIKNNNSPDYIYWLDLCICSGVILACIYFIAKIFIESKKIEK